MKDKKPDTIKQIVVTGRVNPNNRGAETISFTIPLGILQIICVANIPPEEKDEAPVYVKFKFSDS